MRKNISKLTNLYIDNTQNQTEISGPLEKENDLLFYILNKAF